jgi:hypothetical protein
MASTLSLMVRRSGDRSVDAAPGDAAALVTATVGCGMSRDVPVGRDSRHHPIHVMDAFAPNHPKRQGDGGGDFVRRGEGMKLAGHDRR